MIKIDSNDRNVDIETQKIPRSPDLFQMNNNFISPRLWNYWVSSLFSESWIGWEISFPWRNIFVVESDESIRGESSPVNYPGPNQWGSKQNFANSEQFNQLERSALNTIVPGKVSPGKYSLFPPGEIKNITVVSIRYPVSVLSNTIIHQSVNFHFLSIIYMGWLSGING